MPLQKDDIKYQLKLVYTNKPFSPTENFVS